ncbi:hypothetical protein AMECASPLE_015240 [Ameca splendens]|uniref:Uncharacterized protein n=1 Tax=Ameca splendens TaxID=208324 RepID=A0ABV1A863_9TELE
METGTGQLWLREKIRLTDWTPETCQRRMRGLQVKGGSHRTWGVCECGQSYPPWLARRCQVVALGGQTGFTQLEGSQESQPNGLIRDSVLTESPCLRSVQVGSGETAPGGFRTGKN